MDAFNETYKVQLLNNTFDLNSIPLMSDNFLQLDAEQVQIHRNWAVNDLFVISYNTQIYNPGSQSLLWFNYFIRVTDEYGRGLALIVPLSFEKHDISFKKLYRDMFKIPMLFARGTYNEFATDFANLDIPMDAYFADGKWVLYDGGFTSPETTPVWFLLNHADLGTCNMYLVKADGLFRPKSNLVLRKSGTFPLYIYYGDEAQNNLKGGHDIYTGFGNVETKENTVEKGKPVDLRFN